MNTYNLLLLDILNIKKEDIESIQSVNVDGYITIILTLKRLDISFPICNSEHVLSKGLQSLSGSPVTGVPWDFHPRCTTCPSSK